MAEMMADPKDGLPNEGFIKVYSKWAEGSWGAILTGKKEKDKISTHIYTKSGIY
jgi:2,4-dienoyl-CoA reductase-like NADH-dependent reductase (Old Yellow Enzyme family)